MQRFLQGLARNDSGQSVATDQEPITGTHLTDRQVWLDRMFAIKYASDNVSLGVGLSLGLGQSPSINQALHQGVISGDLFQDAVAQ